MPVPLAPLQQHALLVAAPAPNRLPPPSDDLSDLKGPGAGAEASARVFAVVQYRLAPDGDPDDLRGRRQEFKTEIQRVVDRIRLAADVDADTTPS